MDKLMAMRVVARVVETRNMTEAARQLGIGQPFVSRIVADEEHRLGVTLLHRGPPLRPTEAGLAWARDCIEILGKIDEAEAAIDASWTHLRGVLRVAAPAAFAEWVLGPLLPRFLAENPGLSVEVVAERPHFGLDGGTDVAIHVGELTETGALTARFLGAITTGLFAAPAYLETRGAPTSPSELASHATCLQIASSARDHADEMILELTRNGEEVAVPLRPRLAASNSSALATTAEEGLGIALLPLPIGQALSNRHHLVRVLPEWSGSVRQIHAIWPANRAAPRKVRMLVSFLADRVRERTGG